MKRCVIVHNLMIDVQKNASIVSLKSNNSNFESLLANCLILPLPFHNPRCFHDQSLPFYDHSCPACFHY